MWFEAFGEQFDARLSRLDTGANPRVRVVGAAGKVTVKDGSRRYATYAGWLPQGGWACAVVRSSTSATAYVLRKVWCEHITCSNIMFLLY